MPESYRVRYRNGDFEVEVESSDPSYVDAKLNELLSRKKASRSTKGAVKEHAPPPATSSKQQGSDSSAGSDVGVPAIVERINEAENHSAIESHVLTKRASLPRILMCLYFVKEDESPYLSTSQIEQITDQLGIRVLSQNAARTIKKEQKYFTADAVRKKGAHVKYKLNRQGVLAFERVLEGEKL